MIFCCQIYFLPQQERQAYYFLPYNCSFWIWTIITLFILEINTEEGWLYIKQRRQNCPRIGNAPPRSSCTRPQWDPVWWQFPRRRTAWHARDRRRCCSCWERRRQAARAVAANNRARPGQKVPTRASAEIEREKELVKISFYLYFRDCMTKKMRDGIFEVLRSPCVAWQPVRQPYSYSVPCPHRLL